MRIDPTAATYAAPVLESGVRPVLGERYEILGLLGSGAMGNVYRARDVELDEVVAIKVLRPELAGAPGVVERFRREVRLARRVTHPNVARVFDIGERGGEKILSMELVEGEPLSAVLARERRLPLPRVIEIASAICAGLNAAHAAGVVHRDLKPDNVMIDRDGRVVLTDFGIARAATEATALASGGVIGTPAYMAPEQVETGAAIDARADLYALGAMMYELATGERPFVGETVLAIAAARLLKPPPDPRGVRPELPASFASVVTRCMARRPDDRFATAAGVAAELAEVSVPQGTIAPVSPRDPPPTFPSRTAGEKRVAVLPFHNAGPSEHDYLADGLTEDVIDVLSMSPGLRVASRGMVMRHKATDRDPREVGRELDVQVVVEGTVRRAPAGVRISARLVCVADGVQIWAKRFERPDAELLGVSDDVARAIADVLAVEVSAPAPIETDPEAMDLYLRARVAARAFFSDLQGQSLGLLERALERAPNDPRILAAYAMSRARVWSRDSAVARSAENAAARAVELSPGSAYAHAALGSVRFQAGDEAGAVRTLRHALRLGPATAEAHDQLGRILAETTLLADARRHLGAAIALEPETSLARISLSRTLELLGDHEEADRVAAERPLVTGPFSSRVIAWRRDVPRARVLLANWSNEGAVPELGHALLELVVHGKPPYEILEMYSRSGRATLRSLSFFQQMFAEVAGYLDDPKLALASIEGAAEGPLFDIAWLDGCPLFAGIRGEPRFLAARERVRARALLVERAYQEPL